MIIKTGSLLKSINFQMSREAPLAAENYYTDIIDYYNRAVGIMGAMQCMDRVHSGMLKENANAITSDKFKTMQTIPVIDVAMINLGKIDKERFSKPNLEVMELLVNFYDHTGILCSLDIHKKDQDPSNKGDMILLAHGVRHDTQKNVNWQQSLKDVKYRFFAHALNTGLITEALLENSDVLLGTGRTDLAKAQKELMGPLKQPSVIPLVPTLKKLAI
jgi:hypothetical protein